MVSFRKLAIAGVYMIRNNVTGKTYIGQSYDCLTRLTQHWW